MFFIKLFNFRSLTCQPILIQVLIILTDHRTCLWDEKDQVMKQLDDVKSKQVKVITVAFGPYANLRQLKDIEDGDDVLHFGENENFKTVGRGLLHSKCPKYSKRSFQNHSCSYTFRIINLLQD